MYTLEYLFNHENTIYGGESEIFDTLENKLTRLFHAVNDAKSGSNILVMENIADIRWIFYSKNPSDNSKTPFARIIKS